MAIRSKFPLGQLLIEKGIITQEQLNAALAKQKETGKMLGAILMEMGYIDEETIFLPVLAGQIGVDYVNLKDAEISQDAIRKIPAKFASHYKVVPYEFHDNILTLATTEPLDVQSLDEIGMVVDCTLHTVLASEKEILLAIRKYYGVGAETIEQMMGGVDTTINLDEGISEIDDLGSEASISKFLNQILFEGYKERATDIHFEPYEDELKIRYRVDGVLKDAKVPANIIHFKDAINSRIKILSNLNIAEKRLPQDGRFKVRVQGVDLDMRVSFVPTPYGECVVLRLLSSAKLLGFEELGLNDKERDILEDLCLKPHGIVFVTGPTGSGKTTTLYSCLARINTEDNKIITIEDPIEYQLKGITQIQINPSLKLNFAHGLRSMLRQDPDVMMVGEVRDIETADIAIQVALTGHLIFSTLHTNDAASGVTRLLDMGVEPFLITSTVECFIAQRLVRSICTQCREETKVTPDIVKDFDVDLHENIDLPIYRAKGCQACNMSGYTGRQSIYEFLLMTDALRELIMSRSTSQAIKAKAMEQGMMTLRQSGWEKIKKGLTTPEEVIRVTQEEE